MNWFQKLSGDIGGGEDPIGFLLASYEMLIHERKEMKLQINALKLDNDRLVNLTRDDVESPHPSIVREFVNRGRAAQAAVNEILDENHKEYGATGFDADGRAEG